MHMIYELQENMKDLRQKKKMSHQFWTRAALFSFRKLWHDAILNFTCYRDPREIFIQTWTCQTLKAHHVNPIQHSWIKEKQHTPVYLILIVHWPIAGIRRRRSVRWQWYLIRCHVLFWNHLVVLQSLLVGVLIINRRNNN